LKNIDENVIWLGWISFFTDMASSMITTLLPIFVVYVLKEGVDKLGIVIAVATFISYAFRVLFGYLSDRLHIVKPFVVLGYLISAVTKPLLAFSNTYISVALLRGIERMGKAVRSAPKDSLLSSYVKNKQHGKTFGFHKMMDVAGEMSGALVIIAIFIFIDRGESTIRNIFEWTLLPGTIAVFIAIFFLKDVPYTQKNNTSVFNKKDLKLFPMLFIYFGFIFFILSDQFFILRLKQSGYSLYTIPIFVILLNFTQTVSSYYSGILSDKIGTKKSIFIAFVFGMSSVFMLYIGIFWAGFIFLGLFTIISLNSIRSYISRYAISKGFIYGVFYGGVAVFGSLGALAIGIIWSRFGFRNAIIFSEIGMSILLISLMALKLNNVIKHQ